MEKYKIGNLVLKNRIFLAPMLEPNDIAFRILCKRAGAGLTFTGMVHPLSQQKIYLDDQPALQIFANSTKGIKDFIKKYENQVSCFDLNLGCPSPLAGKMGFGSFLQDKPENIISILKEMRESTKKPITIKLRKSENALNIIESCKDFIDALTIHPRTKQQKYAGLPDIEFAKSIRKIFDKPIIYSGNVNKNNFREILDIFDFIILGREAIGNPSVFSDFLDIKIERRFNFLDYLELAEKYNIKFAQIKFQAMNFTKGLKNAKEIREKIIYLKSIEEIKEIWEKEINTIYNSF